MKKILLATFALSMLASSATMAQENQDGYSPVRFYLGTKLGSSFVNLSADCDHHYDCNVDDDTVFTVNPFVGIDVRYNSLLGSRFEVEGFFHSDAEFKYDVKAPGFTYYQEKAEYKSNGMFFNSYLDFHTKTLFTPYVGLGLGYVHNDTTLKACNYSEKKDNFAFNITGGTAIELTNNFAFDIGLRYGYYGEILKEQYFENIEAQSLDFLASVRVSF